MESTAVINKSSSFQFLDDICSRSVALFRNPYFIRNIGAKICARVFGEDQGVTNEIEEFTKTTMLNLRTEVQLHGLVSFDSYMESDVKCHPPRIHVHGEVSEHLPKNNNRRTLIPNLVMSVISWIELLWIISKTKFDSNSWEENDYFNLDDWMKTNRDLKTLSIEFFRVKKNCSRPDIQRKKRETFPWNLSMKRWISIILS